MVLEAQDRIDQVIRTNSTSLNLNNLFLTEIPPQVAKLTQLTELNLSKNQLTEINGLDKLVSLIRLDLSENQITEISGLNSLSKLSKLDISNNLITELKGLDNLSNLLELNCLSNKIEDIKGLQALIKLVDLNLSFNKISEIKGLENNNNIITLNLGSNKIKRISGIQKLKQLSHLYLWNNNIADIYELKDLIQLNELTLNRNILTKIDNLENLVNLERINLTENKIEEFPPFLLKLGLPVEWEVIPKVSGIYVGGNSFISPPSEIILQGNTAIHEYFEQRQKSGEEILNEAKLILLGDGRSGKTSLANRLLGLPLPKEGDRTKGIDIIIGQYNYLLANGQKFKINIWDFAGQDKYRTLHQLFYTESSLYVMVAESGNMNTDFDDWFQTAALFGEGSPLVLILNEFKHGIGMGSFDTTYWKKQFPELLKEVFTVNLGTKEKLAEAEDYIQLLAKTLPHTKYTFPANWAAIRRKLNERRNEQFITLNEFYKICSDNEIIERDSALVLSSVLHKIGECLHYQKNELLKQFIILKNEWATEAVYKILDDKIVAEEKCGFFNFSDLERIWCSEEYQDMRPQLLELMKLFKLAYQLPGKEEFVTPPLLPPARPTNFSWPDLNSIELYIEYEFLPKALLTQFIVSRNIDISNERTLVWRHGVVLEWEDALGEVSKTKLQGRDAFYIRTQGKNRRGMMTVILKTFRELHSEYKGIKYNEKVPCICDGCKTGKNKKHFYDFNVLKFRLENNRYEVECDSSLAKLSVLALLENAFLLEKSNENKTLELQDNIRSKYNSNRKVINLFLSSSIELKNEREKIEQGISRKNKVLKNNGFTIELMIWEDGKYIGNSLRTQDNYNQEIELCNLFIMMIYSKVGKFSLEEFNIAAKLFSKKGMPRICIFRRDKNFPKDQTKADALSFHDFLEQLKKLDHFPFLFENVDMLMNNLEHVIDKLIEDEEFVKTLSLE